MTTLREAAQQALNKFDSMNHEDSIFAGEFEEIIAALRTALAEPEQEPVAWSVLDKRTGKHWYTHESKYTAEWHAKEYSHREPDGSPSMVVTPLYTHPPQRKPLTDEEIVDIWADVSIDYDDQINIIEMARAIERAHGIRVKP